MLTWPRLRIVTLLPHFAVCVAMLCSLGACCHSDRMEKRIERASNDDPTERAADLHDELRECENRALYLRSIGARE